MGRYLLAFAMLLHGAGHVLFVANTWGYWLGNPRHAFFFAHVLNVASVVEGAAGIFWLIPLIGFVATAQGILRHTSWWRWLALRSAAISFAMVVLWWGSLNRSSSYAALAFNAVVIAGLLWQRSHMPATRGMG